MPIKDQELECPSVDALRKPMHRLPVPFEAQMARMPQADPQLVFLRRSQGLVYLGVKTTRPV